jgi:hypothetical protein
MAEPVYAAQRPQPWNWLLVIPIVLPLLIIPLYNFDSPRLFGFPAFYWLQFSPSSSSASPRRRSCIK